MALIVPILPLQLCANSLPTLNQQHPLNAVYSYFRAPLDCLFESISVFVYYQSTFIMYKSLVYVKSILFFILSVLTRCVLIFDRLSPWLFFLSPVILHFLAMWNEPCALCFYAFLYVVFLFVLPDRHILCPWAFKPPSKKTTSKEFAIMSKRLRKERSKRRRQFYDMIQAMEADPLRDPAARRRKFRRLAAKYSPQGGLANKALNFLKDEAYDVLSENQDLIVREIEDLVLLFVRIRDCKSWKGIMANIVSDVKKRFSSSLSLTVLQCIDEIFEVSEQKKQDRKNAYANEILDDFGMQSGELSDETNWLQTIRTAYSNWKLAVNNEGFDKVSRLMSLLVGAGMIQMTSLNVDVGGLQLFSEMSVPKHVSAFDLMDAAMSTVVYFVEGGYECICTGSVKPLLYGEHEMRKFDEDYLRCLHYADYARPGNLALLSIDENDLDRLFASTLDLGKKLMRTTKSAMIRKHIQDRLVRLQDMQSKFTQFRQTGNIREKPYCVGIFGGSSVGKSTIGPLIMTSALYFNGYDASDESTIVLNEHDKYMSNYKSSINGVFLDDVGNTVADFVDTAPTVRILELVNNVKMYANMAEAELKGKVSIQPKIVVCTTNTKDFCAHVYSNEPVSIARRANYIVTVKVRDMFATNNMLDECKVFDHYGENIPEIPDLWTFTVEKAYPIPNKTKGGRAQIGWKTFVWNGVKLQDIGIGTLIKFTNVDSKRHFTNQRKIVEGNSHLSSKLTFCQNCRSHITQCVCDLDKHVVDYVESPYTPSPMEKEAKKKAGSQRMRNQKPAPKTASAPRKFPHHEKSWYERVEYDKLRGESVLMEDLGENYQPHAGVYRRDDWSFSAWYDYLFAQSEVTWDGVHTRLETLYTYRSVTWLSFLPGHLFSNKYVRFVLAWFYYRLPAHVMLAHAVLPLALLFLLFAVVPYSQVTICSFGVLCSASCIYTWRAETELLMESMSDTRTATRTIATERKRKVAYILAGCAVLTGLYTLVKKLRSHRELFTTQGMMHPSNAEIAQRDENDLTSTVAEEQNWANVHMASVPVSHKSKTTTFSDLKHMTIANTVFMSYEVEGKHYGCDAFFVCSNVALIPKHAWKSDNMLCKFTRHSPQTIGGNFHSYVSKKHSVEIPDMDACLVWIPNGGSWKDLRDFFPQSYPVTNIAAEFIWKSDIGEVRRSPTLFCPQQVNNGAFKFSGGKYQLNFDTKVGLCMAPLVSETKSPFFAGFHLGGIAGTPKGCAGTIIRKQIDDSLESLQKIPGILTGASAGTFETEKYGVQFFEGSTIHEKSPLRKLPIIDGKTPNIEVFGSCKGRVTYYSDVVTSHISKHVEKVCGVSNKWGKPKFRKGDPWHASLEHSCHPSHGFEGDLLTRAVEDYVSPFTHLLNEYSSLRENTRPLTRMETVCGIDGKKFVDKMPPNTSVGYPLSGAKRNHLTYLDPTLFEGFNCPAELDDIFWVEFEKALDGYRNGERYYPAFKACLKDEPTKLTKDKVRVFQAAPIVLQMMTRMYFLPIARIFSLFPALSECAVGVNCMGPDWSELGEHMKHFGEDRILAGDYSKYDLRMPAQVMFSAFRILIDVAIICGYSDDDVKVMEGIATDICYPVMAYNGDLIQHIGSNPSGQNLTVYINSIVNSLLFRCAFYDLKGVKSRINFRDVCKLMTYGDDVKGSVKSGYDDFNHLYVAQFLSEHDMKFTMPDKESTPIPFMRDCDADFLKRKNVYCAQTEHVMGALDEDSIFKSLHSNLKSKENTREKLAADNIDGALREWFNHGQEVYELRRAQMQEVAKRANIDHICTQLDKDFDYQVEHWKDRYLRETPVLSEDNEESYGVLDGDHDTGLGRP